MLTFRNKSHIKPLSRINAPKNRGAGASARIYLTPKSESLLTHGNIKHHNDIFNALQTNRDNSNTNSHGDDMSTNLQYKNQSELYDIINKIKYQYAKYGMYFNSSICGTSSTTDSDDDNSLVSINTVSIASINDDNNDIIMGDDGLSMDTRSVTSINDDNIDIIMDKHHDLNMINNNEQYHTNPLPYVPIYKNQINNMISLLHNANSDSYQQIQRLSLLHQL